MSQDDFSEEKEEEIEGLDRIGSIGWGEYPLDSVFVRTQQRTVVEVIKRANAGRYELEPDFQRGFVWPVGRQSRLIESCLMRIPLPVFYVAEARDGRIIVVDGLQRLTTFQRFLKGEFALAGMGDKNLGGKHFNDLPLRLQERIEDTQLTLYILDAKAPERARLDIFERVNSGMPLSRQQMRNSLHNGPATRWLRDAANSELFLDVIGRKKSLNQKLMRDREAINRFCAFRLLDVDKYKGDMDVFLANTLEKMNQLGKSELIALRKAFDHTMHGNKFLFGIHAFRKSLAWDDKQTNLSVINIALFDVCSVLLAEIEKKNIKKHMERLRENIILLVDDRDFNHAITYTTNSAKQVKKRFNMAKNTIQEAMTC